MGFAQPKPRNPISRDNFGSALSCKRAGLLSANRREAMAGTGTRELPTTPPL